jgi:hypothetical protein
MSENEGVMDYRLLEQWQRNLTAREAARASLPASQRRRPASHDARRLCGVQRGMLQMNHTRRDAVAIGDAAG